MAIDKSGTWWRGETFDDLVAYLKLLTEDSYPAEFVKEAACGCGGRAFAVLARRNEGAAKLVCDSCGTARFIADSAENWGRAKGSRCTCPCGHTSFNVGVAFSLREGGDVRWVTVGERCLACGVLGAFVDWGINYGPTTGLTDNV